MSKTDSGTALLEYKSPLSALVLLLAGFLSNFGYRQYLLYWQIRGLKDFLAGKKTWDKFARAGVATSTTPGDGDDEQN